MSLALQPPTVICHTGKIECASINYQEELKKAIPSLKEDQLQQINAIVSLDGHFEETRWEFHVDSGIGSLDVVQILYLPRHNKTIQWQLMRATVPIPTLTGTRQVQKRVWAGDLGKVFGKKKTKVYDETYVRGPTASEIDQIRKHLLKGITDHPNFLQIAN
jgi:hypothetical protein